ncbi:hypothetical protein GCM10017612_34650 [Novosphingobium resinovorum]|nr:hypothetical protein GCM10017612_34650 [Novosphingobium resinovorum]
MYAWRLEVNRRNVAAISDNIVPVPTRLVATIASAIDLLAIASARMAIGANPISNDSASLTVQTRRPPRRAVRIRCRSELPCLAKIIRSHSLQHADRKIATVIISEKPEYSAAPKIRAVTSSKTIWIAAASSEIKITVIGL